MKEFVGKTAVVVGSTSGIGEVIAEEFAKQGANTVVVGRNVDKGDKVVAKIKTAGGEAVFIKCDVQKEEDIKNLMDKAEDTYGRIDIVIGNAGVPGRSIAVGDMTDEDFADLRNVIETDLIGIIQINRYALYKMLKNKGEQKGAIVNIASILGTVSTYNTASYPASKAGITNFTRAQAVTYIKRGVRMNTVSPGYVRTPLIDQLPKEVQEQAAALHPIGRLAESKEIADAVLFLASDKASYIVGANLLVDGGYTAI